jgi:urease accessory protein UreE
MTSINNLPPHRALVKKLDASNRLTSNILARAPSFTVVAGVLADKLTHVILSTGETVSLQLPHHTHLNPGDIVLDGSGMMVRVDAAVQTVLAVTHTDTQQLVKLALVAHKQGRALGWSKNKLLIAEDTSLQYYLKSMGFDIEHTQGELALSANLEGLPMPYHACDNEHKHTHNH